MSLHAVHCQHPCRCWASVAGLLCPCAGHIAYAAHWHSQHMQADCLQGAGCEPLWVQRRLWQTGCPLVCRYALTGREVTAILMQRLVKVDGKVRTDTTYPAGFMDVIQIEKTEEHFRWASRTRPGPDCQMQLEGFGGMEPCSPSHSPPHSAAWRPAQQHPLCQHAHCHLLGGRQPSTGAATVTLLVGTDQPPRGAPAQHT